MNIAFGCDHVGFAMKNALMEYAKNLGHHIMDCGTFSDKVTDYPIYGEKAAHAVVSGEAEAGILICGTGVGISLAANKVPGVRAVVCSEPYSAKLSKQHNDTNILAMGARVIGSELAKMIMEEWLNASFMGGIHAARIKMIRDMERTY